MVTLTANNLDSTEQTLVVMAPGDSLARNLLAAFNRARQTNDPDALSRVVTLTNRAFANNPMPQSRWVKSFENRAVTAKPYDHARYVFNLTNAGASDYTVTFTNDYTVTFRSKPNVK